MNILTKINRSILSPLGFVLALTAFYFISLSGNTYADHVNPGDIDDYCFIRSENNNGSVNYYNNASKNPSHNFQIYIFQGDFPGIRTCAPVSTGDFAVAKNSGLPNADKNGQTINLSAVPANPSFDDLKNLGPENIIQGLGDHVGLYANHSTSNDIVKEMRGNKQNDQIKQGVFGPAGCGNGDSATDCANKLEAFLNAQGVEYVILDRSFVSACNATDSLLSTADSAPGPSGAGLANSLINATACSDSCEGVSAVLGWLVCPVLAGIDSFLIKYGDGFFIHELLSVDFSDDGGLDGDIGDGIGGQDSINEIRAMWVQIRNITTALFVLFFLIAIMGQAVGMIEPYTAKKLIPRIAIAAILTQLSYFISTEASSIVDDIGLGIGDLIGNATDSDIGFADLFTSAFSDGEQNVAGGTAFAGAVGLVGFGYLAGVAGIAYGIFIILPFAISAFMALFTAFITLIIRRIILVGLVVLSPVALATWALPNTEKWAKRWWEWYVKILLAYPIIVIMVAVGKVMAKVLVGSNGDVQGLEQWVLVLGGVIAYFAPYLMMPYAIKLASSTFQNITGIVNDRSKGFADRAKNWAGEQKKGQQASSRRSALADYEETKKLGQGHGNANAFKRTWSRLRSGYAIPTPHNNGNIDDAADGARAERLKSTMIEGERDMAELRDEKSTSNTKVKNNIIDAVNEARGGDYYDEDNIDQSNPIQVAEAALRAERNKPVNERDQQLIDTALSQLITAIDGADVNTRSLNGYHQWDQGVSQDQLDYYNQEMEKFATVRGEDWEPVTAAMVKGMSDKEREDAGFKPQLVNNPGVIENPDVAVIDHLSGILRTAPGKTTYYDPRDGKTKNAKKDGSVVTAEDLQMANLNAQKLFTNNAYSVESQEFFINTGRASADAAYQRAVKRSIDENISSMNQGTPHFLLGLDGAMDNFQKVMNWTGGTSQSIASKATANQLTRIGDQLVQAEQSSQRGSVQSGNVKVIIQQIEARREELGEDKYNEIMNKFESRYKKDGTFRHAQPNQGSVPPPS